MSGRERYPLTSSYISACNARANASSPAVSKVALTAVILDDWKRDVSLNVSVVSLRTDLAVALSTSRSVLFHSDEGLHPFEPTGDAFDAFGCEGEALAGGGTAYTAVSYTLCARGYNLTEVVAGLASEAPAPVAG